MVTVDSQVILKYQNEPFVTIPEYLIHKGADGQKYLQMRASSLPIVQFLTGAKNPSRASLTFYEPFQKLVEKRNEQLDRHHAMGGQEDQGDGDNLFEDQDRPKASRRKIQNLPETVNIYVGNTTVPCLIPPDKSRPKAADIAVPLDSNILCAIVDHIRANVAALQAHMESGPKRKRAKKLTPSCSFCEPMGFLSLAGSHSVAFLRCLQNGIQGPEGYHCSTAKSDPAWQAIEQGWCWVVLAASIEEAIPQLPNFIQMAANSSNSISKAINELEVALHVATAFEKGLSLPDAIQQASQGDVRCRASVPAIAKFVQNFGGGSQGFPLLHFLANFSKQFNATLLVGTELMSTLATLDFRQATCIFPMIRVACWACMLTSPRAQDGFSRILTVNDLQKLKSPGMIAQVIQAEEMLQEIHDPSGADASSADQAKTQTDMQVTDVLAASHKTIAMYTNKDHGAKVFELTDMTDDHATMTHKPLFHDQEEVHVPLQKLPTWKATKALMPMLCPEELAREGMTAKILLEERARSEVQLALHKAAERHHLDAQTIAFGQNPQGLLATKAIRKTIRLVPLGMVNKAKPTTKETKLLIEHGGHTWTIGPFRQNLQFEADSPACLIPFFWCKPTSEPSEVTMVYSTVVEFGITIPCLENPAPLEPRQQLLFLAAHAEASEADHGEASGAAEPSEATPKAKAKNKAKAKEQSEPPSKKPKK
ncbi:unnamed protein product [Effrenium voratum]|nr:unnamed protein product [Effrenium voratum]